MRKGFLPPIAPPEPQDGRRPATRAKAKAWGISLQASVPVVEMMVVIGIGMILLLA